MIEKTKLVELMQNYLQAATELHDYTTTESLYVPTPCGFDVDSAIHMCCTPEAYGSLAKLFDPGSSHVELSGIGGTCREFATIGGISIKILWTTDEYEEVYRNEMKGLILNE